MNRKHENRAAFYIGAYQSLLLGVLMKFFGIVAGLSGAVPFIVGLAFAGYALGARAAEKNKNEGAVEWRFAASTAVLGFLFLSRIYFPNIFRVFFLHEKPLAGIAAFVICIWLSCYMFSFTGRKYSALLKGSARPVMNYAMMAMGFALGTGLFAALVAIGGPEAGMAVALAMGLLLPAAVRVRMAGVVALGVALIAASIVKGPQFARVSFIWGVKDYVRAADDWSPYYKVDIVTFKKDATGRDTALCGLYNYTGMLLATRDFEDMRKAAFYNEALYEQVIPRDAKSALILGSGGGMMHPALFPQTMKNVTAVELDPVIVRLMRDMFSAYNRNFYNDKRVRPVVAEGRAFLKGDVNKYDYIEYESLDTRLYTSSMNIVPIENTLFTREALAAAMEHLSENGMMRITVGTEEDENVVKPIISGLPEGVSYDVYRVLIDLQQLTGIKGSGASSALAGWTDKMPQTAIIIAKKKQNIDRVRAWYETVKTTSGGRIKHIDINRDASSAPTDDHPFLGKAAPAKSTVFIAIGILGFIFALFPFMFYRKNPSGPMHFFFYFIGAGYVGLEILFIVRGARASMNPALAALGLAAVFVAGNAAACLAAEKLRPGKAAIAAATVILCIGAIMSAPLTSSLAVALICSAFAGFVGGVYWPAGLSILPARARGAALCSDALGALPGIALFHISLYMSGLSMASKVTAAIYIAAAFAFILFSGKTNKATV